jgi:hypothetical protein
MIGPNRNPRGRQVIGTVLAPRTSRPSTGQIDDVWKGLLVGTAPTVSAATSNATGYTFTITNYNSNIFYTATTTAGTVSISTNTVTQAGLAYSFSTTVTLTASQDGYTARTATVTASSSAAPCVPAGCTPVCAPYSYSYTTTCATGQGGALVAGSCGAPGCSTGCRYYNLDWSTSAGGSCTDNCGVVYTASCPPTSAQSTGATCCA